MKLDVSFTDFRERLRKTGYIADNNLALQVYLSLQTEPTSGAFLFGPVGAGKTDLVNKTAEALGVKLFFKQVFDRINEANFYVGFTVDKQGNPVATDGVLIELAEYLENNKDAKAILLIDEIDKAQPKIDAMFLDFLQNGRINYLDKRYEVDLSRLAVFFTSNDYRPITDALLRRLPAIYVEKPSPALMEQILRDRGITDEYSLTLAKMIYLASLNIELSKPITAQELYQFCRAIEKVKGLKEGNIDILIYQFLVKDYTDFYALKESLANIRKEDLKREFQQDSEFKDVIEKKVKELDNLTTTNTNINTNTENRLSLPNIEIRKKEEFTKNFEDKEIPEVLEYGYIYVPDEETVKAIGVMLDFYDINIEDNGRLGPFEIMKAKDNNEGIFLIQKEPIDLKIFKDITDTTDVKGSLYIKREFNFKGDIKDFLSRVRSEASEKKASIKYLDKEKARLEIDFENDEKINLFADTSNDKFRVEALVDLEKGYDLGKFLDRVLEFYYEKERTLRKNNSSKADKSPQEKFIEILRSSKNLQKVLRSKEEYPYSLKEFDTNLSGFRFSEYSEELKGLEDIQDLFEGDIKELKEKVEAVKRGELDPDDVLYFDYKAEVGINSRTPYFAIHNEAFQELRNQFERIEMNNTNYSLVDVLGQSLGIFKKNFIPFIKAIEGDLFFVYADKYKSYKINSLAISNTTESVLIITKNYVRGVNLSFSLPVNHTDEDFEREIKRAFIEQLVVSDLINKRQIPVLLNTAKDLLGIKEDLEEFIDKKQGIAMRM